VQLDLRKATAKPVSLTSILFSLIHCLFTYMILDIKEKSTQKSSAHIYTQTHTHTYAITHTHTSIMSLKQDVKVTFQQDYQTAIQNEPDQH